MKLSQVLKDWPEKLDIDCGCSVSRIHGWNDSLTSCDREIDREALAKVIYQENTNDIRWDGLSEPSKELYLRVADFVISTMPKWLKPTERK